jgi:hypothetical protein
MCECRLGRGLSGTDYCLILSVLRVWPGTVPLGDELLPAHAAVGQLISFSLGGRLALNEVDAARLQRGELGTRDRF